ncbi:Pentatricopeptide repeat-containing protein At3g09650, chloroplastic [Linum grandiflorum]
MLKDSRVKVDLIAWNMLVEGYCKLGLVQEAKRVVEKMKENGVYPDVATYGSLANGIALAKKPGEALLLWKEVKDRCEMKWKGESSDPDSPPVPPLRPDEELLDTLADICVRGAFFHKALEIVACMEEYRIPPNKSKYKKIYVEMHSRMFTSKHASQARQDRRKERKRAAEAFKFWLGLPNEYYGSEWRLEPLDTGKDFSTKGLERLAGAGNVYCEARIVEYTSLILCNEQSDGFGNVNEVMSTAPKLYKLISYEHIIPLSWDMTSCVCKEMQL